jgi:hypothetical protein
MVCAASGEPEKRDAMKTLSKPVYGGVIVVLAAAAAVACGGGGDGDGTAGANALSGAGSTTSGGPKSSTSGAPAAAGTSTPNPAPTAASFDGVWTATFDGGDTAGGTGILIGYAITVQGENVAIFADGFQTEIRMNGKGAATGPDTFAVSFDSCAEDDQFQCAGFAKGDPLFILQRKGDGGSLQFVKMHDPNDQATSLPLTFAPLVSWEGDWVADFDGGQTAGGTGIVIGYGISVHGSNVTIMADGFQTETRMNGIGTRAGNDLVVTFDSCGADDQFQCAGLKKGDELFVLKRNGEQSELDFEKLPSPKDGMPSLPITPKK